MKLQKLMFAKSIASDLLGLVNVLSEVLYQKHQGNPDGARAEIARLRDNWENWDSENARIDAETAALKAQGK